MIDIEFFESRIPRFRAVLGRVCMDDGGSGQAAGDDFRFLAVRDLRHQLVNVRKRGIGADGCSEVDRSRGPSGIDCIGPHS